MIGLARLKTPVAVAAVLILATVGVAVQGRQQPAPEGPREQAKTASDPTGGAGGAAMPDLAANRAIAKAQLALIDEALATLHQLAKNGRISFANSSLSVWEQRRLETLRKTGAGRAEILAALEKYLDSLKEEEAIAEALHRSARATQVDVYDVRYRRMEAEIRLNEEKAR